MLRRLAPAAVLITASLALAACTAPKVQTTVSDDADTETTTEERPPLTGFDDVDGFYGQDVVWDSCVGGECTTIAAPLNWDDPGAGFIELALKRSAATGDKTGSLLINPGGPGSSAMDLLDYLVSDTFSPEILAAFDIVAFDPRGVGASTAVDCGPDEGIDGFLTSDVHIESQADLDAAEEEFAEFGALCAEHTGELLAHVDTVSAAKDMDLIRAVLGDDELYYLGYSYGTFLGSTYADLFPENVGRLVLDGALDPTLSDDDLSLEQAAGFENALRAYVEDCQAGPACPLTGSVDDGMQQIADFLDQATKRPIPAGEGLELNGAMAFYGIILTLYDDEYWGMLTTALTEAMQDGTAEELYYYADFYLDRKEDGTYLSNANLAFTAINCLDYPVENRSYEDMLAFRDEVAKVAPTMADWFSIGAGCEAWPHQSTRDAHEVTAPGANPILVVGTTGDPATPYEWAVGLAEQLESGVLLTWEGEGHTAYGRGGTCVDDAVEAYLLTGNPPKDGTVCQ